MICITEWRHLRQFGIDLLTGERCGYSCRGLCDLTEKGKRVVERLLDVKLQLDEPWNSQGIGSIMLPYELLQPLAVFALLEHGYTTVLVFKNDNIVGFLPKDTDILENYESIIAGDNRALMDHYRETGKATWPPGYSPLNSGLLRRFAAFGGTAGDVNRHEMTGRV